jgi:hypothetical protein
MPIRRNEYALSNYTLGVAVNRDSAREFCEVALVGNAGVGSRNCHFQREFHTVNFFGKLVDLFWISIGILYSSARNAFSMLDRPAELEFSIFAGHPSRTE